MPADPSTDTKRGRVSFHYRNYQPLKVLDVQILNKSINFRNLEIKIGTKMCNFL